MKSMTYIYLFHCQQMQNSTCPLEIVKAPKNYWGQNSHFSGKKILIIVTIQTDNHFTLSSK